MTKEPYSLGDVAVVFLGALTADLRPEEQHVPLTFQQEEAIAFLLERDLVRTVVIFGHRADERSQTMMLGQGAFRKRISWVAAPSNKTMDAALTAWMRSAEMFGARFVLLGPLTRLPVMHIVFRSSPQLLADLVPFESVIMMCLPRDGVTNYMDNFDSVTWAEIINFSTRLLQHLK